MICRYYYKGHEFESEIALDDYLIEKQQYESELGDIVFSQSNAKNQTEVTLKEVARDAKEMDDKYEDWVKNGQVIYSPDGEEVIYARPYVGVNRFLAGLKINGQLLFPEFRKEEYWKRRFEKWKNGDFTKGDGTLNEDEINEFGLDPNNLQPIPKRQVGTDSDGNPIYNYDQMAEAMEKRWKIQANSGTAIHNILQIIFTRGNNGEYNYTLNDSDLKSLIINQVERKNRAYINDPAVNPHGTGNVIQETINYARKLQKDLEHKLGDGLTFFPEFKITQNANIAEWSEPVKLCGIIDLLIVDKNGKVHILDYKTSVHSYNDFANSKKLTYSYQMSTYSRMLEKYGIDVYGGNLMVAPIQLTNYRKEGNFHIYDGITASDSFITVDSAFSNSQKIWDNIDEIMPPNFKLEVSADDISKNKTIFMNNAFADFQQDKLMDEKATIAMLKRTNQLTKNDAGYYEFRKYNNEGKIVSQDEADFVQKVTKYLQSQPASRLRKTANIKALLKEAFAKGSFTDINFPMPSSFNLGRYSDTHWVESTFSKYNPEIWEVADNQILESYGIIMLKTKDGILDEIPKQVDFIRISSLNLTENYKFSDEADEHNNSLLKSRRGLTGRFESDVAAQSRAKSLMADAANGNVEIMEMMAIIHQLNLPENVIIGNMAVINPVFGQGVQMSNEQAIYCFDRLNTLMKQNNMQTIHLNDKLRFARYYELTLQKLNHIMYVGKKHDWKDGYGAFSRFKSCIPNWDTVADSNIEGKIKELTKLLNSLEQHEKFKELFKKGSPVGQRELNTNEVSLYNHILYAIAELKGINFKQQLKDHDKWLESFMIHQHGLTGSYLDNPGNLNSDALNLVTKLVTEAYQNTRDDVQRAKVEITKFVDDIKKEANFGYIKEVTLGNQASLYKDLYRTTSDGDFLFVNVKDVVSPAKRKFLEYALNIINQNRFRGKYSQEQLDEMRDNDDIEYYRVPLALGGTDSLVTETNLLDALKTKLSYLKPKVAWERAQRKVQGLYENLYEQNENQNDKSRLDLYKMSNRFDQGEGENRLEAISRAGGIAGLEHNLETLLLKHIFAYSMQENMDAVFPLIKASMMHITTQGAMQNQPFDKDQDYLEDYIKNKIHNRSIVNDKARKFTQTANMLKQGASKLTLAFAPVQIFYQSLQSLWNDISLIIRKPDGTMAFTFQNFVKAAKLVYGDLTHFSSKPTLCQLINEQYGINDMDMNTYIDRISSGRRGILGNFDNMMFKFASRPDFYSRMKIFTAKMIADGCLEAHHVDSEGRLVYDWKKDKRFAAFANNDKSNITEYNKAKALYYAVAQQFVTENAKSIDGEKPFELNMNEPMALPRAYTNKEAESMKSLGDDIYGYYSHEKKSLVHATALGSMWLQFKTYWSGKKNQYLGSGGVKLRGNWVHYEENGQKYYYQVDDQGNILYNEPPTTTETAAPVMRWEGQWQEGVLLTISDMARSMWKNKSFNQGWKDKWNAEDPKLQQVYRSNIKKLGYDLIMWGLFGSLLGYLLGQWLNELKADTRYTKDYREGLKVAAANVMVMSVKNSFLDLNFFDSIGSPLGQWTPFAFDWGGRTIKNWWNVAMGDEDFYDGVVKSSGALKQIKPFMDSIKPDVFRTKREGGTFGE